MKSQLILSSILLATSSVAFSHEEMVVDIIKGGGASEVIIMERESFNHLAVQGVLATNGELAIGLADYTNSTEAGLSFSVTFDNADDRTSLFIPTLFLGLRKELFENTYFAYGLDFTGVFGKDAGQHIDSDYIGGLYISLEQQLTSRVLLSGWIDAYSYEYRKLAGADNDHFFGHHHGSDSVATSTNRFFASGGIGLSYYL